MAMFKENLIWTTYFLLLKTCVSSVVSNSTCGPNYPYSKCYNQYKIYRIQTPEDDEITIVNENLLNKLDVDVWAYPTTEQNGNNRHFDVMVSPNVEEKVQNVLLFNQIRSSILHVNVNDLIMKEVKMTQKMGLKRRKRREEGHRMTWTDYHSLDDIYSFFNYLAERYKGYVSVEDIGLTHENRKMKVIKVCKGGCGKKPAMWIDGGMHAREWISPASVTYILKKTS